MVHSSYFGVGCEFITSMKSRGAPIPNIELVWGKEKENMRFSQFGINLLPLAMGASFSSMASAMGAPELGVVGLLASTSIGFSYTVGF